MLSDRDQFLGHAYVNPRTLIAARIVGRDADYPLDGSLIVHRLRVALALRERLYREPYYRLVYGESDGLPGLVLDRYGDVIVAQSGTAGIDRLRAEIEAAIEKVTHAKTIVWKNDSGARELEGLAQSVSLSGEETGAAVPAQIAIREHRASTSSHRWRTARKPAGSTTRPRTANVCVGICHRARVCSMSAVTSGRGR